MGDTTQHPESIPRATESTSNPSLTFLETEIDQMVVAEPSDDPIAPPREEQTDQQVAVMAPGNPIPTLGWKLIN
jgi:hypothetical protein